MYIDDKLIKILEPHKGGTIEVNCVINLIKTLAKKNKTELTKNKDYERLFKENCTCQIKRVSSFSSNCIHCGLFIP